MIQLLFFCLLSSGSSGFVSCSCVMYLFFVMLVDCACYVFVLRIGFCVWGCSFALGSDYVFVVVVCVYMCFAVCVCLCFVLVAVVLVAYA